MSHGPLEPMASPISLSVVRITKLTFLPRGTLDFYPTEKKEGNIFSVLGLETEDGELPVFLSFFSLYFWARTLCCPLHSPTGSGVLLSGATSHSKFLRSLQELDIYFNIPDATMWEIHPSVFLFFRNSYGFHLVFVEDTWCHDGQTHNYR